MARPDTESVGCITKYTMTSKKFYLISIIPILIILIDQLSKLLVKKYISQPIPLINGILDLNYSSNTGAAFSIMQGNNLLLALITILVIAAIIYYYKKIPENKPVLVSVGLILGGAVGNLIDRLTYGYVIDFIDFQIWPVFNAADSAVTIGAIILIIYLVKER